MSLSNLTSSNTKEWLNVNANDGNFTGSLSAQDLAVTDLNVVDLVASNSIRINADEVYGQGGLFHVTNWSGAIAPTSGNISIIREGPMVTLEFPSITAANAGASTIVSDTPLPADLRPSASAKFYLCVVTDNTTSVVGRCEINETTGIVTFGVGAGGGTYAAAGSSGFQSFTVRYET
jgi:hypothetical protein